MNKKKLFIHIGTQKTGTTTIQSVLSKSKEQLLNEGICYLGRFVKPAREIRVVTQPDSVLEKKLQDEVRSEIKKYEENSCHTYVISNEKFSGDKMIAYRNTGVIAKSLKRVFDPFPLEIKIIVFVRRQDKFLESTYTQKVYSGSHLTFHEFIDNFEASDFHWDELIESYADVFGKQNLIVHGFDKKYLPEKNSLIHTFGKSVGSEFLQTYSKRIVRNSGYSRDTLEIARLANKHLEKQEMRQLREVLRKADPRTKSFSYFSSKERKQFLKNYESSNKKVAVHYLNDPQGELFSTPDYSQKESEHTYKGLTPEAVSVILVRSILVLNQSLIHAIKNERKRSAPEKAYKEIKNAVRRIRNYLKKR